MFRVRSTRPRDRVVHVDAGTPTISAVAPDGTSGGGRLYLIGGGSFTLQPDVAIAAGTRGLAANGGGFGSTTTPAANFSHTAYFAASHI